MKDNKDRKQYATTSELTLDEIMEKFRRLPREEQVRKGKMIIEFIN